MCEFRMFMVGCILCLLTLHGIVAPPVKNPGPPQEDGPENESEKLGLQYEKYLKEVIGVLEKDDGFRKKLEEANISDVKSGKISEHLHLLGDDVRSQLDELKRIEIERLNHIRKLVSIVTSQDRMGGAMPSNVRHLIQNARLELSKMGIDPRTVDDHLDTSSHDFSSEDLKKLIIKASQDLEDLDTDRKKEFKRYEMEKERLRRDRLKQLNEAERSKEEESFREMRRKHREHPKLNHPGSRDQLEEVWEESDGLDKVDFNPKTFFHLHDKNEDGVLDEGEIESLFVKELEKAYNSSAPEDDMFERDEEMNRMREHVYSEVDKNKDRLIDMREFMWSVEDKQFQKNEGWDTLEEEQFFSDDELEEYARQREEEIRRQMTEHEPGEIPLPRPVSDAPGQNPQAHVEHVQVESHHDQQQAIVQQQAVGQDNIPQEQHQQVQGDHQPQEQHENQEPVVLDGQP